MQEFALPRVRKLPRPQRRTESAEQSRSDLGLGDEPIGRSTFKNLADFCMFHLAWATLRVLLGAPTFKRQPFLCFAFFGLHNHRMVKPADSKRFCCCFFQVCCATLCGLSGGRPSQLVFCARASSATSYLSNWRAKLAKYRRIWLTSKCTKLAARQVSKWLTSYLTTD